MCQLYLEGSRAVVDMSKCPYEFASSEFINFHLKDLATQDVAIKTILYKEQVVIELDEGKTALLTQYANVVKQVEGLLLRNDLYGMKEDQYFQYRKTVIRKFYEEMLRSPQTAERILKEYKEEPPEKQIFMEGYQTFKKWLAGILKVFIATKLLELVKKTGDLQTAFLSLTSLNLMDYVELLTFNIPKEAKPIASEEAKYNLAYEYEVQIYEMPGSDAYLYVQKNPVLDNLSTYLKKLLKEHIQ